MSLRETKKKENIKKKRKRERRRRREREGERETGFLKSKGGKKYTIQIKQCRPHEYRWTIICDWPSRGCVYTH